MRLSEQSLRNWIDINLTIEEICQQLTNAGLEVEETAVYLSRFKKIVVGQIISFKYHPYVHSLIVSRVNIGKRYINVISHIDNIRKDMKVFVACIGAQLFNMRIVQPLNISGTISDGVFCTLHDLGLIKGKHEIIKLPCSVPIGLKIQDYSFYKDQIIKINTTFNRVDTFGVFGIARDVAILNNLPIPKIMDFQVPVSSQSICNIFIERNMLHKCSGRIIENINLNTKTPIWMQEKLIKHQIYPINVVVDIINYVFMELGQSVYAFGCSSNSYDICINTLNKNLLFQNNKNISLNNEILVLQHKKKILSFLGNLDFNFFPIDLNNKNLFIGSFFIDTNILNNSVYCIRSDNKIKLNEYFVDPNFQIRVIEYTTYLFLKICGGSAGVIHSVESNQYNNYLNRRIKLSYNNIIKIIGHNISYLVIERILLQLQYYFVIESNFWYITPPTWRPDLLIEEDIISEIIKIYSYDNIPPSPLLTKSTF